MGFQSRFGLHQIFWPDLKMVPSIPFSTKKGGYPPIFCATGDSWNGTRHHQDPLIGNVLTFLQQYCEYKLVLFVSCQFKCLIVGPNLNIKSWFASNTIPAFVWRLQPCLIFLSVPPGLILTPWDSESDSDPHPPLMLRLYWLENSG